MLRLLFNKLSHANSRVSKFSHGFVFSTYFLRPMSEISKTTDPDSFFTVSYLQNSCGLSETSAISAAKKLFIGTPKMADSVLNLMRTHGLTETHIAKIIAKRPGLLSADLEAKLRPNLNLLESLGISGAILAKCISKESRFLELDLAEKFDFFRAQGFSEEQIGMMITKLPTLCTYNVNSIIRPKLEFFRSLGFTGEEVGRIFSGEPYILERSLEKHIIPSIEVLRRVLGTELDIRKSIKACYNIVEYNLEDTLERNILALKDQGVPEALILRIFMIQPRTLILRHHRFGEVLAEVVELGFDPKTIGFVLAIRSLGTMGKALWEKKFELYKSFGLSRDQVYSAFKSQPMFMLVSEKKIKKLMEFFIHKLNLEPSIISRYPGILLYSLEKRILPRCSVVQILLSKDLIKEDFSIIPYLRMNEKNFVQKIVSKYGKKLPDVFKAHQGKIEFRGFPIILKI